MKATIASLIFLLLSLAVSSQTYKYIGIEAVSYTHLTLPTNSLV